MTAFFTLIQKNVATAVHLLARRRKIDLQQHFSFLKNFFAGEKFLVEKKKSTRISAKKNFVSKIRMFKIFMREINVQETGLC